MRIDYGNGTTEYGPGVSVELTGDEVATAVDAWLVAHGVHVDGPRTVTVNGELHGIPAPVLRPRWKAWLARLFGKRIEGHDEEFTMVSYQWRGTLWVWSWEPRR